MKLYQIHNKHGSELKAENQELVKEMDTKNNQKSNQPYDDQNHKEEINLRARENPMQKIYIQRYEERKRQEMEKQKKEQLWQQIIVTKLS